MDCSFDPGIIVGQDRCTEPAGWMRAVRVLNGDRSTTYAGRMMRDGNRWLDGERWRRLASNPRRVPVAILERINRWSGRIEAVRRARRRVMAPLLRVHSASYDAPELREWERRGWIGAGEACRLAAASAPREECGRAVLFVVTLGPWKVGRAALSPMWRHLGIPGIWVGGMVVEPAVRGSGVGRRLLDEIVRVASRLPGVGEIWANVREDNQVSLRTFRSAGFGLVPRPDWEARIAEHYLRCGRRSGKRDLIVCRTIKSDQGLSAGPFG